MDNFYFYGDGTKVGQTIIQQRTNELWFWKNPLCLTLLPKIEVFRVGVKKSRRR